MFPTEFNSKVRKYQPLSLRGYYLLSLIALTTVHIVTVTLIANRFKKGMSNVIRKFFQTKRKFFSKHFSNNPPLS